MIEVVSHSSVLTEQLRERIKRDGPITFCEWMQTALYDPAEGYYRKPLRTIWGTEGDYRTSPERSDLFAGTFARYFAGLYQQLDSPGVFSIEEIGGGAGQFAFGVLKTLQRYFPTVFAATQYVFVEVSEPARAAARLRLLPFTDRVEFSSMDDLEVESGIVFSNELLDAFPVHRVTLMGDKLCEYYVTLDVEGEFEWLIGPASTSRLDDYLKRHDIRLREGQVAEVSLELEQWLERMAAKLHQGYLITVDYGAESAELYSLPEREQGTLRGFRRHAFVENVLNSPGEADLTTTVNWTAVKTAGESLGLKTIEFARQDKFLLDAGLLDQLALQSESAAAAERIHLSTAAREMVLPSGMAASFQVLVQEKGFGGEPAEVDRG